ncbi:septum site-determining protein MinD [compost metagenome]
MLDLPRQIDHITGVALEQADSVIIVVQQSLSHLKDATRLMRILRDDLGVQASRLRVVVNRYNKTSPVTLKDIAEALRCTELQPLPNDYAAVSESQNTGIPLGLHAPRAPLSIALRELSGELLGAEAAKEGLLKRTFGRLFRG